MLEKFTVIDILKSRSDSVATISGNHLKFNIQTCYDLEYPPFIQVMMNAKDKQFAIRSCKENDPNAMAFSKPKDQQKYAIKILFPAATVMIRKAAGWDAEETWNVPGVYLAEEKALVYDLGAAFKPVAKGGWKAKKESEARAAEAAAMLAGESEGADVPADDGEGVVEE